MAHGGIKYRPEMCAEVIEYGKQGMSLTEIAAKLEIAKRTLERWEKDEEFDPAFIEAMQMSRTYSQAWWETWARENLNNPKCNAALWMKNMAGRFRDDWTDRQTTTLDATDAFGKLLEDLNGRTRGLPQKAG